MSLMASFNDGKFVTNTSSSNSLNNAREKNSSGIDSEAFLTLLVAEMQNQDPLEPTSNTEWVSQYATFTQVSEIQNIGHDMAGMKAQDLVGQYVIMKVTGNDGNTDYVSGKVDYVVYEEGDAFLSIDDSLYSIDDLDTVTSAEYMDAYNLAKEIAMQLKALPDLEEVGLAHKSSIEGLYEKMNNLNDYQKSFLDQSVFDKIKEYYIKIKQLSDGNKDSEVTTDNTENTSEESNKDVDTNDATEATE